MSADTIANVLTILVFLGGIIWNSRQDRIARARSIEDDEKKQKKMRERYLIALKEEITINVRCLDKCIQLASHVGPIDNLLKDRRENRPIITYVYFSRVFSSRTEVLQDLNEEVINKIVDFYGKLAELKADITGNESKAFEVISAEGRRKCIDTVIEESKIAKSQGDDLTNLIGLVIHPENIRAG